MSSLQKRIDQLRMALAVYHESTRVLDDGGTEMKAFKQLLRACEAVCAQEDKEAA